ILRRRRRSFHGEDHLARNPMDREVTFHRKFAITDYPDVVGLERECRKFLYIQEVSTSQMSIALGVASFNAGGIDRGLNTRFIKIRFIQRQRARNSCEMPLYVGDHHVFDLKLGNGMSWVDVPGGVACDGLRNGCCTHGCCSFHLLRCVRTTFVSTDIWETQNQATLLRAATSNSCNFFNFASPRCSSCLRCIA